jgi:hypothetical protein
MPPKIFACHIMMFPFPLHMTRAATSSVTVTMETRGREAIKVKVLFDVRPSTSIAMLESNKREKIHW